jgi:hypothetical protein
MSEERCLHCDINEVVREHMEGNDAINLPDLTAKMRAVEPPPSRLRPRDGRRRAALRNARCQRTK